MCCLSFAQFEREMISERTRDKIAAARRKGKWSGGMPILGYTVVDTKLVVDDDEADRVRQIFEMYLEQQSLLAVVKELNSRGWRTKRWTTKKGTQRGGRPFDKNALYQLLTNVAYIGKIKYKDEVHEGEHEAIIAADVFSQVQTLLQRNGRSGGRAVRNKHGALLRGPVAVRCVRLRDEPLVQREGQSPVPLLRLPTGPAARMAGVPVAVGACRRDRTVRRRPDQMRRPRPARDQRDAGPDSQPGRGPDRTPQGGTWRPVWPTPRRSR